MKAKLKIKALSVEKEKAQIETGLLLIHRTSGNITIVISCTNELVMLYDFNDYVRWEVNHVELINDFEKFNGILKLTQIL